MGILSSWKKPTERKSPYQRLTNCQWYKGRTSEGNGEKSSGEQQHFSEVVSSTKRISERKKLEQDRSTF